MIRLQESVQSGHGVVGDERLADETTSAPSAR
jgi:hypothetical protein